MSPARTRVSNPANDKKRIGGAQAPKSPMQSSDYDSDVSRNTDLDVLDSAPLPQAGTAQAQPGRHTQASPAAQAPPADQRDAHDPARSDAGHAA